MVCVAAFIVLCVVGVVVAFLSVFKRDWGAKYWRVLKKSWGCLGKKVRLQKCENSVKDDLKYSLLKKVVIKHPKVVKPLSALIEVLAILIVVVTIWSLVEATKAGLALWTFGTCNVSQPSSCALTSETCSVNENEKSRGLGAATVRWFEEWGEIFGAIPDKLKSWPAEEYLIEPRIFVNPENPELPMAVDIFDPGCSACMESYRNQLADGFAERYNVALVVYPIQLPNGKYKFANSEVISRYVYAAAYADTDAAQKIIHRLFTESNDEGVNYQSVFNNQLSANEAKELLVEWLGEFGLSKSKIAAVSGLAYSEQVTTSLSEAKHLVEGRLRAKGIPTLIYDDKVHNGLYK